MEVRTLPLQLLKAPITLIINVLGAFLFVLGDTTIYFIHINLQNL
jgi:hypothetical protein